MPVQSLVSDALVWLASRDATMEVETRGTYPSATAESFEQAESETYDEGEASY